MAGGRLRRGDPRLVAALAYGTVTGIATEPEALRGGRLDTDSGRPAPPARRAALVPARRPLALSHSRAIIAAASASRSRYWSSPRDDLDTPNAPAGERVGRRVLGADRRAGVAPDRQAFTTERVVARLGAHRALGDELVVDVQLGGAVRLVVVADRLLDELHAEHALADGDTFADELLLGRHADEAVDVVQLAVLHEQGVTAEPRAVGEQHAVGVGVGDLDLGEDLERTAADVRSRTLRQFGGVRVEHEHVLALRWSTGARRGGSRAECGRRAAARRTCRPRRTTRRSARCSFSGCSSARSCASARSTSVWNSCQRSSSKCPIPEVGPCSATAFQPSCQMPRVPSME